MSSWWSSRPGSHGEGLNGRQCKLPLGAALALAEASYYFQVPFPCGLETQAASPPVRRVFSFTSSSPRRN